MCGTMGLITMVTTLYSFRESEFDWVTHYTCVQEASLHVAIAIFP